jgi:hypothetical protein
MLARIDMEGNDVRGPLPSEFGVLTRMEYLNFRDMHLTGTIPTEIGLCASSLWDTLDLESNLLNGSIPSELFYWKGWAVLRSDLLD